VKLGHKRQEVIRELRKLSKEEFHIFAKYYCGDKKMWKPNLKISNEECRLECHVSQQPVS
jgi:hypothetical protein